LYCVNGKLISGRYTIPNTTHRKIKNNHYGYRYYIWKVWAFIILKTHFILLYQTDCITPKRYSIQVVA
jgi:hypothetical protein